MTAKEYLGQAYRIDQRINSKMEQIASLNLLAQKATTVFNDMPGNSTRNIHRMEDVIIKIVDMESEINADIDKLVDLKKEIDDEGFQTETDVVLATVRAYREGRHGSEKWANRAAFSEATDLFRFRTIPGLMVTTNMRLFCDGSVFEITSVEDVKGRGMYIGVLCKEVQPSG